MIVESRAVEGPKRNVTLYYLRCSSNSVDTENVFIGDIMSIPHSLLFQFAWPLLEKEGSARTEGFFKFPFFPRSDVDSVHLKHAINVTATEAVFLFSTQRFWGRLTCYSLRLALFRRALHCMSFTNSVFLSGQEAGIMSPGASSFLLPSVSVEKKLLSVCVDDTEINRWNGVCNSSFANDIISTEKSGLQEDKANMPSAYWVLPYLLAEQDEKWLSKKTQEMVDMAMFLQNGCYKQLILNAAYLSVRAGTDHRSLRALICILRVVLQRWNLIFETTTDDATEFGFLVLVPILNILQCTELSRDDMKMVGKLLSDVRVPVCDSGIAYESLSTATFSTSYTFDFEKGVGSLDKDVKKEKEGGSAVASTSRRTVCFWPEDVLASQTFFSRPHNAESPVDANAPTMVTNVFFMAPVAEKVSVYISKASCCGGVQVALLPRGTAKARRDDVSGVGRCIEPVWFEPREGETHEVHGGCDAIVRYRCLFDGSSVPVLNAEVRVERCVRVDGRRVMEVRGALSGVQLVVTGYLVQQIKSEPLSASVCTLEKALPLLRNGFFSFARALEVLPQFVVDILDMDNGTLCRRVPCRASDLRGVRAALCIIALFLAYNDVEQLSWESCVWQMIIRRVSLVSNLLGKNLAATEIARFFLNHIAPCKLTVPQILEGTISLLISNVSVSELREMLVAQYERAELCVVALSLLGRLKENFLPEEMFSVASLLRDIMMYENGHYLQRFHGCGEPLEKNIRELVHSLLAAVFKFLRSVISLQDAAMRGNLSHRFLFEADEFGPFALVAFSLLACSLDALDVDFVWRNLFAELQAFLPDLGEFAESISLKVEDIEESNMLEALQGLMESYGVDYGMVDGDGCDGSDFTVQLPIGCTMSGATEHGLGVWLPIGRERICSTSTPMHTPEELLSLFRFSFTSLFLSMFSFNISPMFFLSSLSAVELQLLIAPPPELVVALSENSRCIVTMRDIQEDPNGFYFFPFSGTLHHNCDEIFLPPLFQGDFISFCFAFASKEHVRVLTLRVNGVRIAEFQVLRRKFFFLAGVTGAAFLRPNAFRVSFRPQERSMLFTTATTTALENLHVAAPGGLPTRCSIFMFATNVFFYLVLLCARHVAQSCLQAGGANIAPCAIASASGGGGVSATVFQADEVWRGFLDALCNLLRRNVQSLVDSIKRLPSLSEISDVAERVKRNTVLFIYHCFLRNYITIISTICGNFSSSVDMLSALTNVVCCEGVAEREKCAALTLIRSLLRDSRGINGIKTYSPARLWECCCKLARRVAAPVYRPLFSTESISGEFAVCSGGRRVKSSTPPPGSFHTVRDTMLFSCRGIPLDGSLGDIVSFSVRIQCNFTFDTFAHQYSVGVACPSHASAVTKLMSYPKELQKVEYVYAITDSCTDISCNNVFLELQRYAKHWLSREKDIIFGSGDVITVTVLTKFRCVSFERNGMPLGTLYTKIPYVVKVLFPFVELCNKNASAVWMHMPREIGIRARSTAREMLLFWNSELIPRLKRMLEAGDVLSLQILGADGDETSFCYRHPPHSEIRGSSVVRIVRQFASWAEVVIEGTSDTSFVVPSMALEPNYNMVLGKNTPVLNVLNELINIASTSLSFTTNSSGICFIQVKSTRLFLFALRLLSELDFEFLLLCNTDFLLHFLTKLIRVLEAPYVISLSSEHILLEAWNTLALLQEKESDDDDHKNSNKKNNSSDNDGLCISFFQGIDGFFMANKEKEKEAYGGENIYLRCPHCDEEWGNCCSEDHIAPHNLCFTLHCILKRLGVPSLFTGFACDWFLEEKRAIRIKLRVGSNGEVVGEGEDTCGIFTFTGKQSFGSFLRGRCVYKCAENVCTNNVIDKEWACEKCTFINLPDSTRCAICTTARPGATWTCILCGYVFNPKSNVICTTCGHQRTGAAGAELKESKKQAYCERCGRCREYIKFNEFECLCYCEFCQCITRWFPKERCIGLVEAVLTVTGDRMKWVVTFGNTKMVYSNMRSSAYTFEDLRRAAEEALPGSSDFARYVPPLSRFCLNTTETLRKAAAEAVVQSQGETFSSLVPAILSLCSCVVCRWGPLLAPQLFAARDVLPRLRVLDDSWLNGFSKLSFAHAQDIFLALLRILFSDPPSEQILRSLASICRAVMNSHPALQQHRCYLLYAFSLNAMRGGDDRNIREVCYAILNWLLEGSYDQWLNARCLCDVVAVTPIVAGQQQLMVHASLRGVNVPITTNFTSISWLIQAVIRMEQSQPLSVLFDEGSTDAFPYLVELPETRMGEGGELIVGQVRGSVGVFTSRGGRYYYELVIPENFSNDASKIIIMGWGTMQHEVLSSGQSVGGDIHSWGFNCKDKLCILTTEQTMSTPRPIVSGDVIGALLDLEAMMMCWSVNGEELMWVAVSTQGKGEAIYPFVSASTDPEGVLVRLGNTEFKPDGFEDFSHVFQEAAQRESLVEPRSYEFYLQLCNLGNDIVNYGFTADSLLDTRLWHDHAGSVIQHYPLINTETMSGKELERLQPYLRHLRSINALALGVTKSQEMFCDFPYLMKCYQKLRRLLFFDARWAIVERQIDRCLVHSNHKRHNDVSIDLSVAKNVADKLEKGIGFMTQFEETITGQLFKQTKDANIFFDSVMFVVNLAGEVAEDAGGVTRSIVTMMCDELSYREQDDGMLAEPILPFFQLTSHTSMVGVVPNIEFYHENPECRPLFIEVFTWIGKLLGNATLSGYVTFSLTFSRLVWKFLTFDEITIEDYYADIDDTVRGAVNNDEFLLNDEFFYAIPGVCRYDCCPQDAVDTSCSPDGPHIAGRPAIDAHEKNAAALAGWRRGVAERALLQRYDELLAAMRAGITSVVPARSLQLIRWDDLRQRVCGNAGGGAEDVLSSLDLALLPAGLRAMLAEVVRGWPPRKRSQFLLFCSGQRRVPLPEKVQVYCGDNANAIPTAHTCSPISLLLQPYSSITVMREKLEVCLRHMYEFGFA